MSKYRVGSELVTICDDCNFEVFQDGLTGFRKRSDIDHVDGRERECLTVGNCCGKCSVAKFGENPEFIAMGKFEVRVIEWGPHSGHPGRIDRSLIINNPVVCSLGADLLYRVHTPKTIVIPITEDNINITPGEKT